MYDQYQYQQYPNNVNGGFGGTPMCVNPNYRPIRTPSSTNTLEEEEYLLKNGGASVINVTFDELATSTCNHFDRKTGEPRYRFAENGIDCYCDKCRTSFKFVYDISKEEVEQNIDNILNIINTIKIGWISQPEEFARNLYLTEAFLKKIPIVWPIVQNEAKYVSNVVNNAFQPQYAGNPQYYNQQIPGLGAFYHDDPAMAMPIVSGSLGGYAYGGGYQPQPYQYQNPQFGGYPQPQYQQYQTPQYGAAPMPTGGLQMPTEPNPLVQQPYQPQPQYQGAPAVGQQTVPGNPFSVPQPPQVANPVVAPGSMYNTAGINAPVVPTPAPAPAPVAPQVPQMVSAPAAPAPTPTPAVAPQVPIPGAESIKL